MSHSSSDPPSCCSAASPELKLYQAFIFSVPIFFTFILLLLFYLFYLRRRRVDWSSLRMRTPYFERGLTSNSAPLEQGLKKEVREMLPIVVFRESFLIREAQCSICLGEYKANDRLQQIPICGHTFHMDCINLWLTKHTTCPLCRVSLLPASKSSSDPENNQRAQDQVVDIPPLQNQGESPEQSESGVYPREEEGRGEGSETSSGSEEQDCCVAQREVEQCCSNGQGSVVINVEDHGDLRNS